jgi:hypothetical protein
MMHKQENVVKDLDRNQKKPMFHGQFDVHLKDDIDQMVMIKVDQDYNHEEYQAKRYSQHPLDFFVQ